MKNLILQMSNLMLTPMQLILKVKYRIVEKDDWVVVFYNDLWYPGVVTDVRASSFQKTEEIKNYLQNLFLFAEIITYQDKFAFLC